MKGFSRLTLEIEGHLRAWTVFPGSGIPRPFLAIWFRGANRQDKGCVCATMHPALDMCRPAPDIRSARLAAEHSSFTAPRACTILNLNRINQSGGQSNRLRVLDRLCQGLARPG